MSRRWPSGWPPRRLAFGAVGLLWLIAAGSIGTAAAPLAMAVVAPSGWASLGPGSPEPSSAEASHGSWAATRVPLLHAPVEGPLVRGFEEPAGRFGPGHRGVDFGAVPGAAVRAPATGRVTFAGVVAGTSWVTIQVAPGVLVTLGPLRDVAASPGQMVEPGSRLATLAPGHGSRGTATALHLGLRVDRLYVDPLPWLAGLARPRLAPLPEPGGPH